MVKEDTSSSYLSGSYDEEIILKGPNMDHSCITPWPLQIEKESMQIEQNTLGSSPLNKNMEALEDGILEEVNKKENISLSLSSINSGSS